MYIIKFKKKYKSTSIKSLFKKPQNYRILEKVQDEEENGKDVWRIQLESGKIILADKSDIVDRKVNLRK